MQLCTHQYSYVVFVPSQTFVLNKHPFLPAAAEVRWNPPRPAPEDIRQCPFIRGDRKDRCAFVSVDREVPAIVVCDNHILFNRLLTPLDCGGHDLHHPLWRTLCQRDSSWAAGSAVLISSGTHSPCEVSILRLWLGVLFDTNATLISEEVAVTVCMCVWTGFTLKGIGRWKWKLHIRLASLGSVSLTSLCGYGKGKD